MSFSWSTAFEIGLLAVVYYGFIRHLQKTRGGGLLAGFIIVLLMAVGVFASLLRSFDLPHLEWIANAALPALSIALLIIFQPELRLAISRIGNMGALRAMRRFFGSSLPRQQERVVEALVGACERMAQNRIGALIAVQRREGIEGFAQGGSRLDADVTSRLLETIFYPGTALHDGAAFVIDGRLRYAGCKVEVSSSNAQIRQYRLGTRHSAALGLSEESDALVIVVSEERGVISIAKHGTLRIGVSPDDLRQILLKGIEQQLVESAERRTTADLESGLQETRSMELAEEALAASVEGNGGSEGTGEDRP
ncbi:MAG: diadenylate cyclase [Planctomycetota bacterium]